MDFIAPRAATHALDERGTALGRRVFEVSFPVVLARRHVVKRDAAIVPRRAIAIFPEPGLLQPSGNRTSLTVAGGRSRARTRGADPSTDREYRRNSAKAGSCSATFLLRARIVAGQPN